MQKKVKIDVYLTRQHKKEIQKRAERVDLSVSDFMRLKALDSLNERTLNMNRMTFKTEQPEGR